MSNETETTNGTPKVMTREEVHARARRRPSTAAATTETTSETSAAEEKKPQAAEASEEEAPKKRRGPKPGFKRGPKAAATPVATGPVDVTNLPDPSLLPIDYLIRCAKQLRQVKKQIEALNE